MHFLVVHQNCGFKGAAEEYIFRQVQLLKAAGHKVSGMFEYELPNCSEFVGLFERAVLFSRSDWRGNLVRFKTEGITTVLIHRISNAECLDCLNHNFRTLLFIDNHDYHCLNRKKSFPFSGKQCYFPLTIGICSLCSGLINRNRNKREFPFINPYHREHLLDITCNCGRIISPSAAMTETLILNGYPPDNIFNLPPPFPAITPVPPAPKQKSILYRGPLDHAHGIDLLARALSRVKSDFTLTITGTGGDFYYVATQLERYKLQEKTELTGYEHDPSEFYENADIVVLPSRWQEPFGTEGIEAFRYGRPVVGFKAGGIGEWLKDGVNGFLLPIGDVQGMADRIEQLLTQPELAGELGMNGWNMVNDEFNPEKYLESLQHIIEERHV